MTADFGEANVSTTSYIAAPIIEMPGEHKEALTLYLIYRIWRSLEETDRANNAKADFENRMKELRKDTINNIAGQLPNYLGV